MKSFYKFFVVIIFFLSISDLSIAQSKVAYANIDFLIQKSNIGIKTLDKIKNKNDGNIKTLENKEQILNDLEKEIKNKQNIISKDAFDKEVITYRKKVSEFKSDQQKIVNDFNNYRKIELDNVFKTINPVINSYMENNSISILLDTKMIFMGHNNLDLTSDLLKKINEEIK